MAARKAKQKESVQPKQAARYRLRGGALSVVHPVIGTITKDHIEGPNAETFLRAFRVQDEKTGSNWTEQNIETVD